MKGKDAVEVNGERLPSHQAATEYSQIVTRKKTRDM